MIEEFGGIFFVGDDNLLFPGSLEHILDEITFPIFEYEKYRTIYDKAAALAWRIIVGHVFHDGNKRTGMETCRLFLEINGYIMRIDMEIVDMALKITMNQVTFESFVEWVRNRTIHQ